MRILPVISRKSLVGLSLVTMLSSSVVCLAAKKPASKGVGPEFTVQVVMAKGANEATLIITSKIPSKHHIYSTRTSDGVNGGRATKITFDKGSPWTLVGADFTADHNPHTAQEPGLEEGKSDTVEHFENAVTWKRQIRLAEGVAPETAAVSGVIRCQMCNDQSCRLFKQPFKAQVTAVK